MFNRWQKIWFGIAIAVVAGAITAGLWVTSPGQYRNLLEEFATSTTGHELQVAGAIELDLLPLARLTLEDVRLRNPDFPQELASASRIELYVDRGDLLRGELTINELRVDGFHINAFLDAAGHSIWSEARTGPVNNADAAEESGATSAGDASRQTPAGSELPAMIIARDGRLDFQDLRRGRRLTLKNLGVTLTGLNLKGEAFPAIADFELEWFDRANRRVREAVLGVSGEVEANAATGNLSVANFALNSTRCCSGVRSMSVILRIILAMKLSWRPMNSTPGCCCKTWAGCRNRNKLRSQCRMATLMASGPRRWRSN